MTDLSIDQLQKQIGQMIRNFPFEIKRFIDNYQNQINQLEGVLNYKKGNFEVINQEEKEK